VCYAVINCDRKMLRLIRAREIKLMWDGDKVCALAGIDLQEGVGGYGDNVPEALAELVD
jgi:hypothetical protein